MIGHSTTSTIRAAKVLSVNKSVYCIGNIDSDYSEDDVKQYVESLGVRVISCFERKAENKPARFADNKTFRLCIIDADKDKLLCEANWTVGISIQRWVFKPKKDGQGVRAEDGVGSEGGREQRCGSNGSGCV